MSQLWRQDLVLACRRMRTSPAFTVFAAISIAIGVGVTTAMASVVISVCWRSIGIPESARVVAISSQDQDSAVPLTAEDFGAVAEQQSVFELLAGSAISHRVVAHRGVIADVQVEEVSPHYFSVLQIRPLLGRTIDARDEHDAAAVVSYRFWRRVESAGASVLGETLTIDGSKFVVVGVAPSSFEGLNPTGLTSTNAWIPLDSVEADRGLGDLGQNRRSQVFTALGRLKNAVSWQAAATELRLIGDRLDQDDSASHANPEKRRWSAVPVDRWFRALRWPRQVGVILLILSFLVFAVACSNVANLMLARGEQRRRELALRVAVGASRGLLVRQQLLEVALIGAIGGAGSMIVLRSVLRAMTIDLPVAQGRILHLEPVINTTALLVAAAALLLSVVICGLWPALDLTRTTSSPGVATASSAASAPTRAQWGVLRWQMAVSTGLFLIVWVCGSLVIAEAMHDSGIALDKIAVSSVSFPPTWGASRVHHSTDAIVQHLKETPNIEAAAASIGLPFGLTSTPLILVAPGERLHALNNGATRALLVTATDNIFDALGVPIVRGRGFDAHDVSSATNAVVISQLAAMEVFGSVDVLSRELAIKRVTVGNGSPPARWTVIGIARDTDVGRLFGRDTGVVYAPLTADSFRSTLTFIARGGDNPHSTVQGLQTALQRAEPSLMTTSSPARVVLAGLFVLLKYTALLAAILGLTTLLLAAVGLYGVLSQIVTARTREVGIRLALGATRRQVLSLIIREGLRPVMVGLAIGVGIGASVRALIRLTLNQPVAVMDLYSVAAIGLLLLSAGGLACYLPGRRAARLEPNVALREL